MPNISSLPQRPQKDIQDTDEIAIRPTEGPTKKTSMQNVKDYSQGDNETVRLSQQFRVDATNVDYYVSFSQSGGLNIIRIRIPWGSNPSTEAQAIDTDLKRLLKAGAWVQVGDYIVDITQNYTLSTIGTSRTFSANFVVVSGTEPTGSALQHVYVVGEDVHRGQLARQAFHLESPSIGGRGGTHTQVWTRGTTDENADWADASATLPEQTGHNGQFLKTDGTNADWGTPSLLNEYDSGTQTDSTNFTNQSDANSIIMPDITQVGVVEFETISSFGSVYKTSELQRVIFDYNVDATVGVAIELRYSDTKPTAGDNARTYGTQAVSVSDGTDGTFTAYDQPANRYWWFALSVVNGTRDLTSRSVRIRANYVAPATGIQSVAGTAPITATETDGNVTVGLGDVSAYKVHHPVRTVTSNYTIHPHDRGATLLANGTLTITLPDIGSSDIGIGFWLNVVNAGTGTVTLAADTGQTVDGSASMAAVGSSEIQALTTTGWGITCDRTIVTDDTILDLAQPTRGTGDRGKVLGVASDNENELDLVDQPAVTDDSILDLAQSTRTETDRGKVLGIASDNENELALLNAPSGGSFTTTTITGQTDAVANDGDLTIIAKKGGTMIGAWSAADKPSGASALHGVAVGNNRIYLVDSTNGVYHRPIGSDGVPTGSWTLFGEPSGASAVFDVFVTSSRLYIADSNDGMYSVALSNGVPTGSWSTASKPSAGSAFHSIVVSGTRLFMASQASGVSYISLSNGQPTGSWSAYDKPSGGDNILGIDITSNRIYAVDFNNGVYSKALTNGIPSGDWSTASEPGNISNMRDISVSNNVVYISTNSLGIYSRPIDSSTGLFTAEWSDADLPSGYGAGRDILATNNMLYVVDGTDGIYRQPITQIPDALVKKEIPQSAFLPALSDAQTNNGIGSAYQDVSSEDYADTDILAITAKISKSSDNTATSNTVIIPFGEITTHDNGMQIEVHSDEEVFVQKSGTKLKAKDSVSAGYNVTVYAWKVASA